MRPSNPPSRRLAAGCLRTFSGGRRPRPASLESFRAAATNRRSAVTNGRSCLSASARYRQSQTGCRSSIASRNASSSNSLVLVRATGALSKTTKSLSARSLESSPKRTFFQRILAHSTCSRPGACKGIAEREQARSLPASAKTHLTATFASTTAACIISHLASDAANRCCRSVAWDRFGAIRRHAPRNRSRGPARLLRGSIGVPLPPSGHGEPPESSEHAQSGQRLCERSIGPQNYPPLYCRQ